MHCVSRALLMTTPLPRRVLSRVTLVHNTSHQPKCRHDFHISSHPALVLRPFWPVLLRPSFRYIPSYRIALAHPSLRARACLSAVLGRCLLRKASGDYLAPCAMCVHRVRTGAGDGYLKWRVLAEHPPASARGNCQQKHSAIPVRGGRLTPARLMAWEAGHHASTGSLAPCRRTN